MLIVSCEPTMSTGVRVGVSKHAITIETPERNVCGLLARAHTIFTGFPQRRAKHFTLQVDDGAQSIALTVKRKPHAQQWIGNGYEAQSRSAIYFTAAVRNGSLTSAGFSFRHCGVEVVRIHLTADEDGKTPPQSIYPFVAALIEQRSLDMGC